MRPISLRWQIQGWHTLLLVVVTVTLLIGFYRYERRGRVRRLDAALTPGLVELFPRFVGKHRIPGTGRGTEPRPEERWEASGHYIVVWFPDGRVNYRSAHTPSEVPAPGVPGPAWRGRWNGGNREVMQVNPLGDAVLIGLSGEQIMREMHSFALQLAAIGAGVIALGVLGGSWIARHAVRPIEEISATAKRIAEGERESRIPTPPQAAAELRDLAAVLNQTFDRLSDAYAEQVRFTADASHELATPVSVIVSQLQVALEQPRAPQQYIETLQACLRAGTRMRQLTHDLLELAAYDAGPTAPRVVECDLAEVAREAVEFVTPLAEERGATIVEQLASVRARVDPVGLSQALINLLTNAIRHNAPGVRIEISLRLDGERALVAVRDFGAGIPPEALPRLFHRFYRVDPARSRAQGGSGLGLAITRAIVEAHGGEITAANAEPGAVFTIILLIRRG